MPKRNDTPVTIPILPLRDMVLLPYQEEVIYVGRANSIAAVQQALKSDRKLAVVMQRTDAEVPSPDDIYHVGTLAVVEHATRTPNNVYRVRLKGTNRITIESQSDSLPFLTAAVHPFPEKGEISNEQLDLFITEYRHYAESHEFFDEEDFHSLAQLTRQTGQVYYILGEFASTEAERIQAIFEEPERSAQILKALALLGELRNREQLQQEVGEQLTRKLHAHARKDFIRQQIRLLQQELGEDEESLQASEVERFRQLIERVGMPDHVKQHAVEELERLRKTFPMSPDYNVIRTYLEWLTALPWSVRSDDNLSLANARAVLDADHYDLERPKERILEYIAVLNLTGSMRGQILCFVGPPGVGKTSLAASIARALGRKFVRISLGGVHDEAEIRGHRRTYIGALPGKIIQAMKRAGTINPVILLDEVDKLGRDFRGDPAAALLEVLDPEQNRAFNDHFLEVDYDLSQVLFIATANVLYDIPDPLLDRMEVIELSSYLDHDKLEIAKRHIIPRLRQQLGLHDFSITFDDEAILTIIRHYTREAGVRNLERELNRVLRKIAQRVVEHFPASQESPGDSIRTHPKFRRYIRSRRFTINVEMVHELLRAPRFQKTAADHTDRIGVATGLAWTSTGGDILPIEVTIMPGSEKLLLTGKLGEVMKESAQAALSFVRSNASLFGIPADFAQDKDIHIHVPEGAIPKDGPSAGITMTIALISAARGIPVRGDIAMTGEITLRGMVLPVGGLNEKLLAARRNGIVSVIVPRDNRNDIEELPVHLTGEMTIHYVSTVHEALPLVFRSPIVVDESSSNGHRSESYVAG